METEFRSQSWLCTQHNAQHRIVTVTVIERFLCVGHCAMPFLYVTLFIPHQKYVGTLSTPQVQVPQICPGPPFFRGSALDFLQQCFPSNPVQTMFQIFRTVVSPVQMSFSTLPRRAQDFLPKVDHNLKKLRPEGRQPRAPCCEKTGCLLICCFVIFNVLLPPHGSRGLQHHNLLSLRKECVCLCVCVCVCVYVPETGRRGLVKDTAILYYLDMF